MTAIWQTMEIGEPLGQKPSSMKKLLASWHRYPIGKKISIWNYTIMQDGSRGRAEMEIVGIIQNFQAASLRNPILPQVIVIDQSKWNSYFYYARTEPGKEKATIKAIRNIFKKHSKSGDPTTCNVQTISQILDRLSTSEDASLQLFTLLALFLYANLHLRGFIPFHPAIWNNEGKKLPYGK